MCDDSRYILDELFGKERNVVASKRKNDAHYWNEDVCKNILVSKCFNDLWKHTKYDHEGECSKRHDQFFINEFNCAQEGNRFTYIQDKLKEVDKILTKHEEQVEQSSKLQVADRPKEIQDRLDNMERQINLLTDQSEKMGELGKIEESERLIMEADNLKKAREDVLLAYEGTNNPFKTYKICEVCGARQSLYETENKVKTHLDGRIHQGFSTIRVELQKLQQRRLQLEKILEEEARKQEFKEDIAKDVQMDKEKLIKEKKEKEKERSRSRDNSKEKSKKKSSKKKKDKEKDKDRSKSRKHNKQKYLLMKFRKHHKY
ncbi:unnamed protein product (macronuclear) [Paramecium tetraurelia]|uniref:U1-type domain-containing protein n=1 Tax=Paramecium tetraurelia TaxID=5888 RepID=A0DMU6_PARTE|nr:uncharacterized protein GSPATT00018567001 [Paramecium tetraurelia]CAK84363.1 unnamed protein product [Paramecium tetraurelia]|eukprot:XP_001451760.1 hypothetical protein (macronuclear) [Paramecium tetraurelia strain d4-2]